jgi:uncharacterized protein (TIGR00369 family)
VALSPEIVQKINQSFADQSLMGSIGASIASLGYGVSTLTSPIREGFKQQQGFGHAALTFALGDTAAGYAALSVMPENCEVLTTEMKINLLAPAQGVQLRAEGRVIKPGRRLVIVQADVYADQEDGSARHIALLTGSMIPVEL